MQCCSAMVHAAGLHSACGCCKVSRMHQGACPPKLKYNGGVRSRIRCASAANPGACCWLWVLVEHSMVIDFAVALSLHWEHVLAPVLDQAPRSCSCVQRLPWHRQEMQVQRHALQSPVPNPTLAPLLSFDHTLQVKLSQAQLLLPGNVTAFAEPSVHRPSQSCLCCR